MWLTQRHPLPGEELTLQAAMVLFLTTDPCVGSLSQTAMHHALLYLSVVTSWIAAIAYVFKTAFCVWYLWQGIPLLQQIFLPSSAMYRHTTQISWIACASLPMVDSTVYGRHPMKFQCALLWNSINRSCNIYPATLSKYELKQLLTTVLFSWY